MTLCDRAVSPGDPLCSVKLWESLASRKAIATRKGGTDWTLLFFLQGTNDECLIKNRLEVTIAFGEKNTGLGIPKTFHQVPLNRYEVRNLGWELWEIVCLYSYDGATRDAMGPMQTSFSTIGGRERLTQSIDTRQRHPLPPQTGSDPNTMAPELDGAIGFDGERVKGVDVNSPLLKYTETWIFTRFDIFGGHAIRTCVTEPSLRPGQSRRYSSKIEAWTKMTATVHGPRDDQSGTPPQHGFRWWSIHEVLFLGVTMNQVSADDFECTFEFQISRTKCLNLPKSVSANKEQIVIPGWDYTWFSYAKKEVDAGSSGGNIVTGLPKFVYVERVYPRTDFTALGIGIAPPLANSTIPSCSSPAEDLQGRWHALCGD